MDNRNSFCPRYYTTTGVEDIDSNLTIVVTVADCGEEFGIVFGRVSSGKAVQFDSLGVLVAVDDILNMLVRVLFWKT